MDEFSGVVVLGLVMTGVVAALVAVMRWKQDREERGAARVVATKRTASPGRGREVLHGHNLDAGEPDLGDFVWQPLSEPDPPVRN
jgi:hypothetical protein